MTIVPSTTFAGGVISRGLWGRVDLNKYQTGVKEATNFRVDVEGGLWKRFGTYFVSKPKFQNKVCKLVPWRIADDDSYILEFGDEYIRFIRLGGHVLYPAGPFTPDPDSDAIDVSGFLEVPTPYLEAEVRELKFTFANDIAYIFHKNHQPAELRRLGLYDWELEPIDFNPHSTGPTGLNATWEHFDSGNWQTGYLDQDGYDEIEEDYKYQVSATLADGLETLPSAVVTETADLGHRTFRVKLTWNAKTGAEQYTLYKGKSGLFGFIGYVDAADPRIFYDTNFAPSYDVVPIVDFEGFDTATSVGEWPRVGEFWKQRMAYAATISQPQTIWFSRAQFFAAMSTSKPLQDDDAIKAPLVGNSRHTIHHMIQLKKFLVFTDSGEWVIETTNNEALSTASIDPKLETAYGCDPYLSPTAIGDRVLFVQNMSGVILDMGYEFATDAYKADDLSRLARDLFKNKHIEAWAYAGFPHNLVYTVCDDGSLPVMTYNRQHEIWGWALAETEGEFTDVACVAEVNQHAAYFQVTRLIDGVETKFIERTEVLYTESIEDLFYVDCGLTFKDVRNYTVFTKSTDTRATFVIGSHGRVTGDEIQLEFGDSKLRFVVVSSVGSTITADTKFLREIPDDFPVSGSALFCADLITGFDHLAGQSGLIALADGQVVRNISINGDGEFPLDFQAARVHCGFPYSGRVETLDLDDPRVAGQFRNRTPDMIYLNLHNSRNVLVGAVKSDNPLIEIKPRESDQDYDEANRALNGPYEIPSDVQWGRTCSIVVESHDPVPCNILNIVPDIIYED